VASGPDVPGDATITRAPVDDGGETMVEGMVPGTSTGPPHRSAPSLQRPVEPRDARTRPISRERARDRAARAPHSLDVDTDAAPAASADFPAPSHEAPSGGERAVREDTPRPPAATPRVAPQRARRSEDVTVHTDGSGDADAGSAVTNREERAPERRPATTRRGRAAPLAARRDRADGGPVTPREAAEDAPRRAPDGPVIAAAGSGTEDDARSRADSPPLSDGALAPGEAAPNTRTRRAPGRQQAAVEIPSVSIDRSARMAASEPEVRVTIGRIEVNATLPPPPIQPRERPVPEARAPAVSLDEYLDRRKGPTR
jgi:hypothetical protein